MERISRKERRLVQGARDRIMRDKRCPIELRLLRRLRLPDQGIPGRGRANESLPQMCLDPPRDGRQLKLAGFG